MAGLGAPLVAAFDRGSLLDAGSSRVRAESGPFSHDGDRVGSGVHRFSGAVASGCVLGMFSAANTLWESSAAI